MLDETVDQPVQQTTVQKKSLLNKYDISLDQLTFEYVQQCKNVKELEKIVKILRSGEEGYYPDLQKNAENQLRSLAPNSRVLRVEEPIVRKEEMLSDERKQVDNDMMADDNNKQQNTKKLKKPTVSDYATWDKYDAESELLKMDADEERKKLEEETELRKQKAVAADERKRKEHSRLNDIKTAETMPDAEKSTLALREKDRGNEYYKTCNYDDAIDYYTASIAIYPNPAAYNNRAASYLKQGKYDQALSDVNKCLELEPENAKGLYRRGLCLQHKNRFDEALQDMQAVLKKEPRNLLVQHVAKELRQQCRSVPRSVRMLVEDQDDKVVEMSEADAKKMKVGIEVNEWGLARNMCSCYTQPPFLNNINTSGIAEHLIYKPEESKKKKKKKLTERELCNLDKPLVTSSVCNGNIDESLETNQIVYEKGTDGEADDEWIPKKIKIIETVKSNNDSATHIKERDRSKKCIVKDMRGQSHVQGQKESEMMEQFGNIKIDEPMTTSKSDVTNENKNRKLNTKQKQNSNQENHDRTNLTQTSRRSVTNYEFHVPSEKQPISIASKYTQKVASAKNMNAQFETSSNKLQNSNIYNINNNNDDNNRSISVSESQPDESMMTPFQFFQSWMSIKVSDASSKEYANLLRRIPPSKLHSLLGNKMEDTMLVAMLKALAQEFDITNSVEADLVKQYLVSLSNTDRFQINVRFLTPDIKKLTSGLIEKVGGDDILNIKKSYEV
ncbi:spag1 axonemal dynein assembly factor isoform X2 [Lycorma delicatula]|uniref:spag1 axonemal dynein assembly factor isoform X2 n=1 Tax=Lycorma delicatula TaxID=130591 RepID=UPI003F514A00